MKLKISDDIGSISSTFNFAKDIHEFGQRKNVPRGATSALWFRGQADVGWELKPSIGRTVQEGGLYNPEKGSEDFYQTESFLLQRFKRDGYPFVERTLTDWEAITFAQHHKLPTRLLDWTSNPLVALFFAAEEEKCLNTDGAVFMYRPRNIWKHHISTFEGQNPKKPNVPKPLKVHGIKIVFPMLLVDRLITQSGGFTIQDPLKCLIKRDSEEFDGKSLDIFEICKWILPKKLKMAILDELHRLSINRRTLFPDLDGVGYTLWKQESFRQVKGK